MTDNEKSVDCQEMKVSNKGPQEGNVPDGTSESDPVSSQLQSSDTAAEGTLSGGYNNKATKGAAAYHGNAHYRRGDENKRINDKNEMSSAIRIDASTGSQIYVFSGGNLSDGETGKEFLKQIAKSSGAKDRRELDLNYYRLLRQLEVESSDEEKRYPRSVQKWNRGRNFSDDALSESPKPVRMLRPTTIGWLLNILFLVINVAVASYIALRIKF